MSETRILVTCETLDAARDIIRFCFEKGVSIYPSVISIEGPNLEWRGQLCEKRHGGGDDLILKSELRP